MFYCLDPLVPKPFEIAENVKEELFGDTQEEKQGLALHIMLMLYLCISVNSLRNKYVCD